MKSLLSIQIVFGSALLFLMAQTGFAQKSIPHRSKQLPNIMEGISVPSFLDRELFFTCGTTRYLLRYTQRLTLKK